jgi:hypothetical protein
MSRLRRTHEPVAPPPHAFAAEIAAEAFSARQETSGPRLTAKAAPARKVAAGGRAMGGWDEF